MSTTTIRYEDQITMVTITCGECGIVYAMNERFYDQKQRDGTGFYCPNGHNRYFTHKEELEKKVKKLEVLLEQQEKNTLWWHEEAERVGRSLSATRGVLTRTKNRIANGVCPCCNRQFVNLHRHMAHQHPEYTIAEEDEK